MAVTTAILAAGVPESGKSTFLAALWHLATNNSVGESVLTVTKFVGNREYIQQLENAWLAAQPMPHTPRDSHIRVELFLHDSVSGADLNLTIPDLSGEDFQGYFANRSWPEDLDEFVQRLEGVLLFVSPLGGKVGVHLSEIDALASAAGEESTATPDPTPESGQPAPVRWDPEKSPTPVILVDLLTVISDRRLERTVPLRVAIIISAWDTLAPNGLAPDKWFRREYALLHQFLSANFDAYAFRVYGVSAQGGDVTDQPTKERLLALTNPRERILVVDGEATTNDLTKPIAWILAASTAENG